jgi:hypothetical protein
MMDKPNIIFLNHRQRACGVYQYGLRSGNILKKSEKYNFVYVEVSSAEEFVAALEQYKPVGVIFNYTSLTMPWWSGIREDIKQRYPHIVHYGLYHEGPELTEFDYVLYVDPSHRDTENAFAIPRPLFETDIVVSKPEIPIFFSFGFGFEHKGFERIVELVNDQFNEAIVKFQISTSFYGDPSGERARGVIERCHRAVKKEGIHLSISHDFMTDDDLLRSCASSSCNIFLYEIDYFDCGVSSVLDYALSVDVPLAIRKSTMFRHMREAAKDICVENKSLREIMDGGTEPLKAFKEKWSQKRFVERYENIVEEKV